MSRKLQPSLIRTTGTHLTAIFLGCIVVGYLLVSYEASLEIWLLTEIMLLYLAWAGTGAIALAVVGALGIVWSATLSTPILEHLEWPGALGIAWSTALSTPALSTPTPENLEWPSILLNPAQIWAGKLFINWLVANSLIFTLGFTTQLLRLTGQTKRQTFWLVAITTNLGLILAQLSRLIG